VVLAPEKGRLAWALRGVDVEHVPFSVHLNGGSPPPRPVLASRVGRVLKRQGIALLHANSLSMSFVSARAADEAGIPALGHVRDIQRLSRARIADLSNNRRVICVSRAVADSLLTQGVTSAKVVVVHNAVDTEVFRPSGPSANLRAELLLPEDAPLVASIGQICLRKGQIVLLRAFARVLKSVPDATLVILGERLSTKQESIAYEENLHAFVEEHGIENRVRFLGYRDEIPSLLRDIDVLAHSAHQEPLGRVLLEASASGVPVVATDVGGTREIVEHDETGYVVPAGRPGPLARMIATLLNDDRLRKRMGVMSRERAKTKFVPRDHAARIAEIYQEVLG
jgi:glycosyltransferase involved in cell wall biosynthesis